MKLLSLATGVRALLALGVASAMTTTHLLWGQPFSGNVLVAVAFIGLTVIMGVAAAVVLVMWGKRLRQRLLPGGRRPPWLIDSAFFVVVAGVLALAGATIHEPDRPPVTSPDGTLTVRTTIERSQRDPTRYGCVIVEVRDQAGHILLRENSRASTFVRWDVAWISNHEFRLTSSDIGPTTWTRQPEGTWQRKYGQ